MNLKLFTVILSAFLISSATASDCNCGDFCGACQTASPKYIRATLSNLQGCPYDFHQGAAAVYSCFNNSTMDIILKQDPSYSCGYYYYGPPFTVENCEFQFRLGFYLNMAGYGGTTEFSIIVQEDYEGWYDLYWSTASVSQSCGQTGSAEFSSYCNVPVPDIQSGTVSWSPLTFADGHCPGCGDANEIPENCDELTCETIGQYALVSGGQAYYNGPFMIYSPSKCEKNAKTGNAIQTAKIVCPGAEFVSATASSSSPSDIIARAVNGNCHPGNIAIFNVKAFRGTGNVTLTATFYKKANAEECIAEVTTKTITVRVQPDPGDECCNDEYHPMLLKG
ncbi:MAG: hypothetical protein ABFD79_14895, partial [Phycisphaerales bacterium]